MEQWDDEAIVLSVRPHGEGGAILTVLTSQYGKQAGYLHGLSKFKQNGGLQTGTSGHVTWSARLSDQMGAFRFDPDYTASAVILHDRLRLTALQSACALCCETLPDRHANQALFAGLSGLLRALPQDTWGVAYVAWEIALLREVGFALDLSRCTVTGDTSIAYVSPKTGRGVSEAGAGDLAPRLLPLPEFLKQSGNMNVAGEDIDILTGLQLTGYFLDKWVFVHHTTGIPASRLRLAELYANKVHGQNA